MFPVPFNNSKLYMINSFLLSLLPFFLAFPLPKHMMRIINIWHTQFQRSTPYNKGFWEVKVLIYNTKC